MNTRILMAVSAFILGLSGIALSFFPEEIVENLSIAGTPPVLLQLLGALYFSFAILNWTAKANLIGGIYSKPVALGNFTHFFMGGLALAKTGYTASAPVHTLVAGILYLVFAVLFGYVLFTGPAFKNKTAVKV